MSAMSRLSSGLRREWLSLILAVLAAALALNGLLGARGARDLAMLRGHRMALEANLRRLTAENATLADKVHKLRSDDRYLERLVRSELGLARPGEVIYRFRSDGAEPDR